MSEINIPENIRKKADILKKGMKVGPAGVVEITPEAVEKALTEGLDLETVERVQNETSELVSATGLALGELGIEAFKKDDKLDQVSVSFAFGKDRHSAVFQRSREVPINRPGEPRELATKYGLLTSSVTVYGVGNKGTLKRVRQHLSEEAAKVLAS